MMLKYYPDTNKSPGAARMAQLLNEAVSVLGDPGKRAQYDQARDRGQDAPSAPPPPPPPPSEPDKPSAGSSAPSSNLFTSKIAIAAYALATLVLSVSLSQRNSAIAEIEPNKSEEQRPAYDNTDALTSVSERSVRPIETLEPSAKMAPTLDFAKPQQNPSVESQFSRSPTITFGEAVALAQLDVYFASIRSNQLDDIRRLYANMVEYYGRLQQ